MSYDDPSYLQIQNSANLRIPDGRPLSLVAKLKGYKSAKRVAGPDLMQRIFEQSTLNNYKHYFYGSTPETLKALKENLLKKFPTIQIVGMFSPPFRELSSKEDKEIIEKINEANPDIIWVGLGAPKQEVWMNSHKNKVKGLMIGVGAGFDYHAGKFKRAPKWMQNLSLEWLYRLFQEPKRLFKRYMKTNFRFIKLIIKNK